MLAVLFTVFKILGIAIGGIIVYIILIGILVNMGILKP